MHVVGDFQTFAEIGLPVIPLAVVNEDIRFLILLPYPFDGNRCAVLRILHVAEDIERLLVVGKLALVFRIHP